MSTGPKHDCSLRRSLMPRGMRYVRAAFGFAIWLFCLA